MNGTSSTASVVFHETPAASSLTISHLRYLVGRYRWDLVVITLFGIALQWFSLIPAQGNAPPEVAAYSAFGLPAGLILAIAAFLWAFRMWDEFPPGDRQALMSLPAHPMAQLGSRVLAGALLWAAVLIVGFLAGRASAPLLMSLEGLGLTDLFPMGQFVLGLVGLMNAFLAGTILALLFKRPAYWFLIWVPVGLFLLMAFTQRFLPPIFRLIEVGFGWEVGLFAGIGLSVYERVGVEAPVIHIDDPLVVLVWLILLATGTVFAMMRRRTE